MPPSNGEKNNTRPPQARRITDMYVPGASNARPTLPKLQTSKSPKANSVEEERQTQPRPETTVKTEKTSADIQVPSAKFWLIFLATVVILGGSGAVAYYFLKYRPAHRPSSKAAPVVDNTNHISDDTLGLKFAISKDLTAIDKADLVKQNPNFVYGFKQTDVTNVVCIVSQQKRSSGGAVAPTALRDGTLQGIQKSFPDAKLDNYQDVLLKNGQDAASLVISYTDNKVAVKEKMVVVATDPRVTFVFCTSPTPLYDFYNAKFQPFFDSLEVY